MPTSAPRREVPGGLPSTGPYRFARADLDREVLLVRNPRFHEWSSAAQPAGYPDRIRVRIGPKPEAQLAAIKDGRADLAADPFAFTAAQLRRLSVSYASRLRFNPSGAFEYAFLDTRSAPFDDPLVRRALNLAVDRSAIAGAIDARPTCQVLPTNTVGHRAYCPYGLRGDLRKARRLSRNRGRAAPASGCGVPVPARPVPDAPGGHGAPPARLSAGCPLVRELRPLLPGPRSRQTSPGRLGCLDVGYPSPTDIVGPLLTCGGRSTTGVLRPSHRRLGRRASTRQTDDPHAAYDLWADVDRRLTDAAPGCRWPRGSR